MKNRQLRAYIRKLMKNDIRLIQRYEHAKMRRNDQRYHVICDLATHYIVRTLAEEQKCSMASMCAILVQLGQQRFNDVKRYAEEQSKKSRRQ